MVMKYFVCSDIHGCYDEWMCALINSSFDINNPRHKLVICGDLFDRGNQPKQIIDFILVHKDKIILVKGNHDDAALRCIKTNKFTYEDYWNGTADTFKLLDPNSKDEECSQKLSVIAEESGMKEVLDMAIDYYETKKYVFVHGFIPVTKEFKYNKKWRNATQKEWQKARWTSCVDAYKNQINEPNKTIVCGHYHCSAMWHLTQPELYDEYGERENFEPFISESLIAIDSSVSHTGRLNVAVLEDEEF